MSTRPRTPGVVALISSDKALKATIAEQFETLEYLLDDYPEAIRFFAEEVEHIPWAEDAKLRLAPNAPARIAPLLVIVDANVKERKSKADATGQPAVDLLKWLQTKRPDVSILVAASGATPELQYMVLNSLRISLWNVRDPMSFAEALAGLALASDDPMAIGPQYRRRITIDVRRTSASYRVSQGPYEYMTSDELKYRAQNRIDRLVDEIAEFSPFDPNQPMSEKTLHHYFSHWGQDLFDALLKEAFGNHIEKLLDGVQQVGAARNMLELRFEIGEDQTDYADLFSLPFELVNAVEPRRYLCARVPMARRMRLRHVAASRAKPGAYAPGQAGAAPNILFLMGNEDREVTLTIGSGSDVDIKKFAALPYAREELEVLSSVLARCLPPHRAPAVLGDDPRVYGNALLKQIESELSTKHYDIVHFCGHSISLGRNRGTYLIFPGQGDDAVALPVETLAEWLRGSKCHLLVLSSCEGASVLTAMETMRNGVEGVIGFRWCVDAQQCKEFFGRFYCSYLEQGYTYTESFRDACNEVHLGIRKLPTSASALAVLRD